MATKSKSSKQKYPLWIKALCALLSAVCAASLGTCVLYAALIYEYIFYSYSGTWELTDPLPEPFASAALLDRWSDDLYAIETLLIAPQREKDVAQYAKNEDAAVEAETARYLAEKAEIIRAEIQYVATHYNIEKNDDYYYNAYMRDFGAGSERQSAEEQDASQPAEENATQVAKREEAVRVDEQAPYNVRYCQSLLNTVSGVDWLQYASLVRSEAFAQQEFKTDFSSYLGEWSYSMLYCDYTQDEAQIRAQLRQTFRENLSQMRAQSENERIHAQIRLNTQNNLRYLARAKDGTVYTNMPKESQSKAFVQSTKNYLIYAEDTVLLNPEGDLRRDALPEDALHAIADTGASLYLYFEDGMPFADGYGNIYRIYRSVIGRFSPILVLWIGLASACLLVVLLILQLIFCGQKVGAEQIQTAWIDRIPTDVHFLASACLVCGTAVAYVLLLKSILNSMTMLSVWMLLPAVLAAVGWLFGLEWLTSTVRIKKSGGSFFRRCILWRVLRFLWRAARKAGRKAVHGVRYLLQKPKKIQNIYFLSCGIYLALVAVLLFLFAVTDSAGLFIVGLLVLTALFLVGHLRNLRMLDSIIDASCDRSRLPLPNTQKMPPALRKLAENLSYTNQELEKAVADAVRNERTKTELITNVSHDLKTPLTAIISYVDLLKKCDVPDPDAQQYLAVLEEKSAKLKRLIEDLIEASKVSTGNVTLQRTKLNLSELAMQAVVEFTPQLEKQTLEIRFTQPETAPVIYADGAKTYRILENLLSNVQKYAAPNSRVYARVADIDGFGIFEIKNISRDPLDVEPQELMERFVRGDQSRSQDGNGLGLSIAQQLCTLQGGRLEIGIDGDLFKATVRLPLAEPQNKAPVPHTDTGA